MARESKVARAAGREGVVALLKTWAASRGARSPPADRREEETPTYDNDDKADDDHQHTEAVREGAVRTPEPQGSSN